MLNSGSAASKPGKDASTGWSTDTRSETPLGRYRATPRRGKASFSFVHCRSLKTTQRRFWVLFLATAGQPPLEVALVP